MAKAKYHSLRGKNSALILIKENAFVFTATAVYVPKDSIPAKALAITNTEDKDNPDRIFDIPDGFKVVDFIDFESGEVRTTEDGKNVLKVLAY